MKQEDALWAMKMGYNVFLTGSAGSGKTFLLSRFIDYLSLKSVPVAVTASTGIAASHLGGMTIHSWSGLGVNDNLNEKELKTLQSRSYLFRRFNRTKVLIVDEISMLSGRQLDLLDKICKFFKNPFLPFGGMQVIFSGDFFQLPPVKDKSVEKVLWASDSEIWNNMNLKVCYLEKQYRQDDKVFIKILNSIRKGNLNGDLLDLLKEREGVEFDGNSDITKLYTHNIDVDQVNYRNILDLKDKMKSYTMKEEGKESLLGILKKSCLAHEKLYLKRGAKVMFVKNNFDRGYVNGTLGTVVSFDENRLPVVRTLDGKEIVAKPEVWVLKDEASSENLASVTQIPLRLAWAITVHKSQGMTLDSASMDLGKCFEFGMGYVALSRLTSLEGLFLEGLNEKAFKLAPEALRFDNDLRDWSAFFREELRKISWINKKKAQDNFLKNFEPIYDN